MFYARCSLAPPPKVYFSNRSAAYLKLGDAKSKALKDAERCMELAPEWSKSFSRLGAAQHALGRFDAAVQTFKVGRGEEEVSCVCGLPYVFGSMFPDNFWCGKVAYSKD